MLRLLRTAPTFSAVSTVFSPRARLRFFVRVPISWIILGPCWFSVSSTSHSCNHRHACLPLCRWLARHARNRRSSLLWVKMLCLDELWPIQRVSSWYHLRIWPSSNTPNIPPELMMYTRTFVMQDGEKSADSIAISSAPSKNTNWHEGGYWRPMHSWAKDFLVVSPWKRQSFGVFVYNICEVGLFVCCLMVISLSNVVSF